LYIQYLPNATLQFDIAVDSADKNEKAWSNEPHALKRSVALPFRWPTRLADGLELEVFYTKCLF
jgi:hypothetical protein